jgi:alanyl-tRNA synthetase
LAEFRNNNVALAKERDELLARLRAAEENANKTAPKLKESEQLAQEVARLQKEWADSQAKAAAAESKARQERFRGEFMQVAAKHKVRDDAAAKTLWAMASTVYKEKDGAILPLSEDGTPIYSKKDVTRPVSVEEWFEGVKESGYKDLFAQPTGGGAKGSSVTNGAPGRVQLTRQQAQFPSAEQKAALAKGQAEIIEG